MLGSRGLLRVVVLRGAKLRGDNMVVAISEIVKNGILFDLKKWKKGISNTDQFVQFIENIFDTLTDRNIDYLLVGGVALLSYVEGRNTQDIDLILAKSDLKALPEITISEENNDFIRGEFGNLTIDILLTQNKLFKNLSRLDNLAHKKFVVLVLKG